MHRTQLRGGGFERRNLPLVVLSGWKIHGTHSIRTHRMKDGWMDRIGWRERKASDPTERKKETRKDKPRWLFHASDAVTQMLQARFEGRTTRLPLEHAIQLPACV